MRILYSNFTNNSVVGNSYAGAIRITTAGVNCTIVGSNFINNSAQSSGAISWAAGDGKLINSTFKLNNARTTTGGAISWTGSNAYIFNCTFSNNSAVTNGGALFVSGVNATLLSSTFINNSASNSNDVYTSVVVNLTNNTFKGSYWFVNGSMIEGYRKNYDLKVTASNDDIQVSFVNGTSQFMTVTVNANTVGNTLFSLENLKAGNYTSVSLKFTSVDGNTYEDYSVCSFLVFESVFYINNTGTGKGTSLGDATNWTYAYNNAVDGTKIIFLNDTFNTISSFFVIGKSVSLIGSGMLNMWF